MPEPITIDGKKGLITYLDALWHPVEASEATLAKVLFDDGTSAFYNAEPARTDLGGAGSGNFDHAGRPGEVGGSGAGGGRDRSRVTDTLSVRAKSQKDVERLAESHGLKVTHIEPDEAGSYAVTVQGGESELDRFTEATDYLTTPERDAAFKGKMEDEFAREKEITARGPVPYAHAPKSRAEMVQKRQEIYGRLQKLGIGSIQFPRLKPNAITAASHMVEVLEEMKEQGYRMPDSVRVVIQERMHVAGDIVFTRKAEGLEGDVKVHRALTVRIPARLPPGANLDDAAYIAFGGHEREGQPRVRPVLKDGKRVGWQTDVMGDEEHYDRFASNTMNDVIRHEIGHVQAGNRSRGLPATEAAQRAARRVSLYAASDGEDEFLAESFAKLSRGEKLPKDSMDLYNELGGPQIRGVTKHLSYREKLQAFQLWDESQHPREDNGKFAEGAGGGSAPSGGDHAPAPGDKGRGHREERDEEMAKRLPENPDSYFITDKDTLHLPLDMLDATRAREKGIRNAAGFMEQAKNGTMDRRKPITVIKKPDGRYDIHDGNSTFAVASKAGWGKIPAKLKTDADK